MALSAGEGRRLEPEVAVDDLVLGGQRYGPRGGAVATRLEISRTAAGYALRLAFAAEVEGPCMRCLDQARVAVEVDAREVDQPSSADEELRSPYVGDEQLDLSAWAHDALSLALPAQLLCRPDCRGLCPVCGASLNDADPAEHAHEAPADPRWAKLRELRLD